MNAKVLLKLLSFILLLPKGKKGLKPYNKIIKKMDDFIEYKKFEDEIDAEELIQLLKNHSIQYELQEPVIKFRLVNDATANEVIVKIKPSDFESVDKIQETYENEILENNEDHYLYTFSDKDIIEVLVTPSKWKNLEVKIAKKIANERGLKPTASEVLKIRDDEKSDVQSEKTKEQKLIQNGTSFISAIGIFSLINIIAFIFNHDFRFILGLNVNYFIYTTFQGVENIINIDSHYFILIITILISLLFIVLGTKSKQGNKKAYLFCIILYGFDTLLSLLMKDWFSLAFHCFAMLIIGNGYIILISKLEKKV
ncbi:hypothetical protein FLJU110815_02170 [Flavobacterium jumunjinense]